MNIIVMKFKLFAHMTFCFFGACFSDTDVIVLASSDRPAVLKSIFQSFFIHFSWSTLLLMFL